MRRYLEARVIDRYALKPGSRFIGPAVVEERESTVIVGPRGRAHVDADLNLVVALEGSRGKAG